MSADPITLTAPAKVNLYLHVTGKRPDGYHLLDSLVVFTDFGDLVTVTPAAGLSLRITGSFAEGIPIDGRNLVLQAAEKLQALAGIPSGADIILDKRIPVAAGVGGGSADAAATLKALCQLWDLDVSHEDLDSLALDLGADVPVCLAGRATYMAGIGEDLTPTPDLPSMGILLANPLIGLSTPAVFKARTADFSEPGRLAGADFSTAPELATALGQRQNDLEPPAKSLVPEVAELLAELKDCDDSLLARMSGSGATCFALFADEAAAVRAAESLKIRHPDWWFQPSRILA